MSSYKAVNPGDYNRRVTLQQESPAPPDALGTPVFAWSVVAQTWARMKPKTYQFTKIDGQTIVKREAYYTLRRMPSTPITTAMRLVDTTEADATQTYSIRDIQDVAGARREVQLLCELWTPDQGV